jgi:hypothetical protein
MSTGVHAATVGGGSRAGINPWIEDESTLAPTTTLSDGATIGPPRDMGRTRDDDLESLLEGELVPTRSPAVRRHDLDWLRVMALLEDPDATAHLIVELCSWAARRRPRDPAVGEISDQAARRAVYRFVVDAISSDGRSGPSRDSKGGT